MSQNDVACRPERIHPRLSVLTESQIEWIHTVSLDILASVGVRVDSEKARRVLARGIGATAVDGDRVRIPPEVVSWAIEAAPASVALYDRLGQPAFTLGPGQDQTRFGIGVTTLFYQDPLTDELTPFARSHMAALVRLGDHLPHYDVISTVGVVQDVPPEDSDLYGTLDMVANTTKPLVLLVSEEKRFPLVLDMLESLTGDLAAQPFVIPYFNPVTPLIINAGTSDKMFAAIERGLPFIYSNYGMAGMSTPITPGGAWALLNAELLAGLVLSQLIREGTPVILGILPAYFDMKTMVNFYDPYSLLLNLACAELMAHYGLPHCGTSGSGRGWGPDLLAAEAYWMNHLSSCMGKVGLSPFVGDTLTSKAFSPVNVVFVHEIIAQTRRFVQGFLLDEAAFCLKEIAAVGPGGNFLTAPSTLRSYRNAYYTSSIYPRWSMEMWQKDGCPRAEAVLREHTLQLLEESAAPPDQADLVARGEAFIRRTTQSTP